MLARFKHLFIKEFLELFRDPRMRALTFIFPAVQILILAQAFVLELKNVDIALIDHDRTSLSRELIAAFTGSGYFRIAHENCSEKEAEMLLASEKIRAVFIIPSDFSRKAFHPEGSEFSVITDGTGSNDSGLIQGYASRIFSNFIKDRQAADSSFFAGIAWFNPNLESRYYYIPGLIGIQMVVISFLLASIAIVKEKEVGTIEQLMVTPIRVSEFILGKTLPYLAIGCIASTIMLLAAFGFYGITVKGSWFLLYLSICVFLAGNLGGALIISVISKTQQQALLTAFFFMLPFVMLSGLLFPVRNMPESIQTLTMLNPLRWFFQILHSVIVKGGGIREIAEPLTAQIIIAISFITIAIASFRKSSE